MLRAEISTTEAALKSEIIQEQNVSDGLFNATGNFQKVLLIEKLCNNIFLENETPHSS